MNKLSTVFVEITNFCSKKCKHCFNEAYREQIKFMEPEKFGYIVRILKHRKIEQIKIVGGEPLEHPFFLEILKIMDMEKIPYIIVTNSNKVVNYIPQLKTSRWLKQVRVSVDGNETVHDYIREKDNYKKTMEVVKMLKKNNINVVMNYTINKLNYFFIEEIWEQAHDMGIDILYGVVKHCDNHINEELLAFNEYEAEQLFVRINEIKDVNQELYVRICNNLYDDDEFIESQKVNGYKNHIGCCAGQKSCVIDPIGNVWPCVLLKDFRYFGNIFETNFDVIWKDMNVIMSNLNRSYEGCDLCLYREKCTGGCRGNAFYFGNIEGKDPNCWLYSNYKNV